MLYWSCWCYSGVIVGILAVVVLYWRSVGVILVLSWCFVGVIVVLWWCHWCSTRVIGVIMVVCCFFGVLLVLYRAQFRWYWFYIRITGVVSVAYWSYIDGILVLFWCYKNVSLAVLVL